MSTSQETIDFVETPLYASSTEEYFVDIVRQVADLPASDLYFNWNEEDVALFARHLGIVRPWATFSHKDASRLINHVKTAACMDLSRRHVPQDGRCILELEEGRRLDLRVSTIPTLHGLDMSIRLLQRDRGLLDLENLGCHSTNL